MPATPPHTPQFLPPWRFTGTQHDCVVVGCGWTELHRIPIQPERCRFSSTDWTDIQALTAVHTTTCTVTAITTPVGRLRYTALGELVTSVPTGPFTTLGLVVAAAVDGALVLLPRSYSVVNVTPTYRTCACLILDSATAFHHGDLAAWRLLYRRTFYRTATGWLVAFPSVPAYSTGTTLQTAGLGLLPRTNRINSPRWTAHGVDGWFLAVLGPTYDRGSPTHPAPCLRWPITPYDSHNTYTLLRHYCERDGLRYRCDGHALQRATCLPRLLRAAYHCLPHL